MYSLVRVFSAVRVIVLFVCVCAVWYVLVRMSENLNSDVCCVVFFMIPFSLQLQLFALLDFRL